MEGAAADDVMKKALSGAVRAQIGSFAVPDAIHWCGSGLVGLGLGWGGVGVGVKLGLGCGCLLSL